MGFSVLRHGQPIQQVGIRNRLSHGITYSGHFEEWEACVAARLDIERWETGLPKPYSRELKTGTVAWYRLRCLVDSHSKDAEVEKGKRNARKARR